MDVLAETMGWKWTYVDSADAQDHKILRIMDHVRNMRKLEGTDTSGLVTEDEFRWPDILSSSTEPLQPGGSDMWSLPLLAMISLDSHDVLGLPPESYSPLTCSTNNTNITYYEANLPQHQNPHGLQNCLLEFSCQCNASNGQALLPESEGGANDAAIILEDDIDMELDSRDAAGCRTSYALVPRPSLDRS
jgi:hypothetical protein